MTWILCVGGLYLAGAMCLALSVSPSGQQHPGRVRAGVWTLWALGGLVAAAEVVTSVIHLATPPLAKPVLGESIMGVIMGGMLAWTAVPLLGISGFWAAVARLLKRRH